MQGSDYTGLRWEKYQEAKGRCQKCGHVAPFPSKDSIFDAPVTGGHLHHVRGRGAGKRQDTLEATMWLCATCHREIHDGEKPVPAKV